MSGNREPYDEAEVEERGTPFMLASRPPKTEPGSSAADVDGAKSPPGPQGHHESVGERQGRQPGSASRGSMSGNRETLIRDELESGGNRAAIEAFAAFLAENQRWLTWSDGRYPDDSPGDVIAADQDGTITLDDGITTWNPLRALAFKEAENQRLREALEFWYREVDKSQRLDNTGGDSAVAVTLNSWDEALHSDREALAGAE